MRQRYEKILVVDDYNTMRRIIRNLLKQIGFDNVDDASDGQEALIKMGEKAYDLIVSDWNMEPMNGVDLLKAVRADDKLKAIPFLMVMPASKPEDVIKAKTAGANAYIIKPFNAEGLRVKIDLLLPTTTM